jgi:hypothetical protein
MAVNREALEMLGREQLIQEARRFGVRRPEVMTRVELIDEVLRLATPNPVERKKVRGWLGVARDLVASVVEQGLNLPDAAALIRGDFRFEPLKPVQPPVATVTLAEIYGAQGHFQKALAILDEVLVKEPDHEAARKLRDRLERERVSGGRSPTAAGVVPVAVAPEDLEPPTPRQTLEELPAFATAHVPVDDDEPLTPRRLSKQPPAEAPTIADYDSEPLTPRRLSKPPIDQPPEVDETKPAEPARAEQVGMWEAEAVLIRTSPSRAVVYFEVSQGHVNGGSPIVHVVEWRPGPTGVERVVHEFAVVGPLGTVVLEGLPSGVIVRGALGHKRHGRFKPLAVCAEVTMEAGNPAIAWAPRARKDYGPIAGRAASHVSV